MSLPYHQMQGRMQELEKQVKELHRLVSAQGDQQ